MGILDSLTTEKKVPQKGFHVHDASPQLRIKEIQEKEKEKDRLMLSK